MQKGVCACTCDGIGLYDNRIGEVAPARANDQANSRVVVESMHEQVCGEADKHDAKMTQRRRRRAVLDLLDSRSQHLSADETTPLACLSIPEQTDFSLGLRLCKTRTPSLSALSGA